MKKEKKRKRETEIRYLISRVCLLKDKERYCKTDKQTERKKER